MTSRYRIFYDYCNLGGVTSVFAHRVADMRRRGLDDPISFYFRQDLGGMSGLLQLPGVDVEICPSADFHRWAEGIIKASDDPVVLVDQPEILGLIGKSGRRILYEVHTSVDKTFRRMQMVSFAGVDLVVCTSEWLRRKLHEVVPEIPAERISVIHNFVTAEFSRDDERTASTAALERPVLWVGKISPDKNWEDGFDILRMLRERIDCTPVFVTGGAPDSASVTAFLYQAQTLGILERFRWISNLPHQDVPGLLNDVRRAGGVLLSTSKFESFGLAVLEAMTCGLPVVAAPTGGLAEVFDGIEDYTFPLGDNQRAAAIIHGLMASPTAHAKASRRVERRARFFARGPIMSAYLRILTDAEVAPDPDPPAPFEDEAEDEMPPAGAAALEPAPGGPMPAEGRPAEKPAAAGAGATAISPAAATLLVCNVCEARVDPEPGRDTAVNDICPACTLRARHRALAALFREQGDPTRAGASLMCNCIPAEQQFLFTAIGRLVNFDVRPLVYTDLVMDVQDMSRLDDRSFDTFVGLHMLHQVEDDRKALAEIGRVLKPDGVAILTVPLNRSGPTTLEADVARYYGKEALTRYGVGNYRKYGLDDFRALLATTFSVSEFAFRDPLVGKEEIVFLARPGPPAAAGG